MTTARMGRQYIEQARGRVELVRLALSKGLWVAVVREAQECVELFLKGALRREIKRAEINLVFQFPCRERSLGCGREAVAAGGAVVDDPLAEFGLLQGGRGRRRE